MAKGTRKRIEIAVSYESPAELRESLALIAIEVLKGYKTNKIRTGEATAEYNQIEFDENFEQVKGPDRIEQNEDGKTIFIYQSKLNQL